MSHFAAGIIWRIENGVRECLIIRYYLSKEDYEARRNAQIKFSGGTNNDHPNEELLHTLHREVVGETGLQMPASPLRVWVSNPKPNRDGNGSHTKHFFLASRQECRGTLRTEVMNDNGDWLAPPEWMAESELEKVIFHTHRPAFDAAKARLGPV